MKRIILIGTLLLLWAGVATAQTVNWTYPAGTAATGFNVWRGVAPCPSQTTKLTPTPLAITVLSYKDTDPALVKGQTYCYGVTALNAQIESPMSNLMTFTVPLPPPTVISITASLSFSGGGAGGQVVSNPQGINLSVAGTPQTADYPIGSTVTFTATPKQNNSRFAGWGNDCAGAGLRLQCTLANLSAPAVVSAKFVK